MAMNDEINSSGSDSADLLAAAIQLHQTGDIVGAVDLYRQILDREPENYDAWHLLGVAAHQRGEDELAQKLIAAAIELKEDVADYHSNLGMVLRSQGGEKEADDAFRRALEIDPSHGKALSNLAGLLRSQGEIAAAVDYARRAVKANDQDAEAHNNLGNALMDCGRDQGWLDDALASYQRAIQLQPDYALAHWNYSLALLTAGHLKEGFEEMYWRWRWSGFPAGQRHLDHPPLTAETEVKGKRVLLYAEQGLGDAIHFLRYARAVRDKGAEVIIECSNVLAPLVRSSEIAVEVIGDGETPPPFDFQSALLDLPHIFQTELDNMPDPIAYLTVDPDLIEDWRRRMDDNEGLNIGLNWCGNPASPVEKFRRLPSAAMAPLASISGVNWFSLQKEPGQQEVPAPAAQLNIIDTGPAPLEETAALITALDLVITTDTAIAHLAGALGKPAWVLLHQAPDWRWLADRVDSPWYPTLRLFRQLQPGDWTGVIEQVRTALKERD